MFKMCYPVSGQSSPWQPGYTGSGKAGRETLVLDENPRNHFWATSPVCGSTSVSLSPHHDGITMA